MSQTQIPFAPHSPGFAVADDKQSCYCVLHGPQAEAMDQDELLQALTAGATQALGTPAEFIGGIPAGDILCHTVFVMYFAPEKKE